MFVFSPVLNRTLALDLEIHLPEIKNGNQKAFEVVFKALYGDLCRYAYSILKDKDESEDLVQNTFVIFWEKRDQILIMGSLKSYLYKSVYNHFLNKIKHLGVRQEHQNHFKYTNSEAYSDTGNVANELENRIDQAIERLPTQCGKIFKMSRYEELKYQEIADVLDISVKTVENQIGKALKLMRLELSEYLVSLLIFFSI